MLSQYRTSLESLKSLILSNLNVETMKNVKDNIAEFSSGKAFLDF